MVLILMLGIWKEIVGVRGPSISLNESSGQD